MGSHRESGVTLLEIAACLLIVGLSLSYLMVVNNQAIETAGNAINHRYARLHAQAAMAKVLRGQDPEAGAARFGSTATETGAGTRIIHTAKEWEIENRPGFRIQVSEVEEIVLEEANNQKVKHVTVTVIYPVIADADDAALTDIEGNALGQVVLHGYYHETEPK